MGKPDSVDDLYPRKWLAATDLNGRTATVKIAAVDVETCMVALERLRPRAVNPYVLPAPRAEEPEEDEDEGERSSQDDAPNGYDDEGRAPF